MIAAARHHVNVAPLATVGKLLPSRP